jgi:hypothetical protein
MAKLFSLHILVVFLLCGLDGFSQVPIRGMPRFGGGGAGRGGGGNDSLQFEKRDFNADSVTVMFRYLDTARYNLLDSSISDFYKRIPLKPEYIYLGNNGNAIRSFLFSPLMKPGFDAGFHAFDPYGFNIAETRFMNTTRPYTELNYLVGSKAEQQVGVLHTQNITPDWNFVAQYRLINSPGAFNSQNSNHRSFRFNTDYITKDQRYAVYFIVINNALQSSENGGITSDTFLVNANPAFNDRFNIPTNIADSVFTTRNFFNVALRTGNKYNDTKFLLRHNYDFGKKDSVVTDSSVRRFFLPTFRIEHTIQYNISKYRFLDVQGFQDSAFFQQNYDPKFPADTIDIQDHWKELVNDFSVIQFPDPKNPLQFIKVGASLQNMKGTFSDTTTDRFSNVWLHGEYRNRTRNRKWDMLLQGSFFLAGRYSGDYSGIARLKRQLSPKIGFLEVGFQNVNRTPSYIFDSRTAFPVETSGAINKENISHIFGILEVPRLKLQLTASYYLVSNYTYFTNFNQVTQNAALFNFLRVGGSKEFRVGRNWRWYADLFIQTKAGNAPVNLPFLFTRHRFAYEAKLFRNLNLSTGVDLRYNTPYKADNYSPILGQFFYQDVQSIAVRPDIAAYVNFRIMKFTAFTRLENLNTLSFKYGFGFKDSNLAAPLYSYPGLVFRLGVFWGFVN